MTTHGMGLARESARFQLVGMGLSSPSCQRVDGIVGICVALVPLHSSNRNPEK